MMVEMVGFRMLAPYFGYSVYVSGALLSVVMLALALGYLVGGRWADRSNSDQSLYGIIFISAVLVLAMILFYQFFLNQLLPFSIVTGSLIASFVLFTPSMFFLSMISPWLIKILARKGAIGTTAGTVYSISTLGSIVGTLLASFYLIPELGIKTTLMIVFSVLMLVSVAGLMKYRKVWLGALCLLLIPFLYNVPLAIYPPKIQLEIDSGEIQILQDIESKYSRIMTFYYPQQEAIAVRPGFRYFHSVLYKNSLLTGGEWDYYVTGGLAANPVNNILILGQGSGATYKILKQIYPQAKIICLDIDEKMMKTGIDFAELKVDENTSFVIEDARPFLRKSLIQFDLISIDVFTGGPFVPFYLVTNEFFEIVSQSLSNNGVFVMNVNDHNQNSLFAKHVMNSAKNHIKSLFYSRISDDNTMVYGFKRQLSKADFIEQLQKNKVSEIQDLVKQTINQLQLFQPDKKYLFFTDDHAPVEKIIFSMLENKNL
ncbi:MAG: fused MFS/spermidine synthase [Pseudomonadota bacterium]